MISQSTDLVRRDSIEELVGHRARALQLYRQAVDTLAAAGEAHKRACGGSTYTSNEFLRDMRYLDIKGSRFDGEVRTCVDRDMWRHLINATKLGSLMDKQERNTFEESLKKDVPEATADNVFATLSRLAGDANMIFRRGLVNAFRGFCGEYHSHDGFKIGKRFLVSGLIQGGRSWPNVSHYRDDSVKDIDRCMHILDGKPAPEYQQGVLAAIRTGIGARPCHEEVTSDYFKVRLYYGNGNAHFYPLRPDLVEQANRLIAVHCGETLGAGHSARHAAE